MRGSRLARLPSCAPPPWARPAQGFTPTAEGNDQKLTLHYWSRMALATELLPLLRAAPAGSARVVSILSGGVHSDYRGYKEDPELRNDYSIS